MTWNDESKNKNNVDSTAIKVLLAGPSDRVGHWSSFLQTDSRFKVSTFATDHNDLMHKLSYNPEVILLDATMYAGPSSLVEALTQIQCAVYVVVPGSTNDVGKEAINQITAVKGIFIDDVNMTDLTTRIMNDIGTLRKQAPALEQAAWATKGIELGGLRVVTVWSRQGGTGKSTIAAALAEDAARRGYRTLLIGLSAPDVTLPVIFNLKTNKNIGEWIAHPSTEVLRQSVQNVGGGLLDVLVGLPDMSQEKNLRLDPKAENSISSLCQTASHAGYAVVIMDVSADLVYPHAIAASNTWVVPAIPTLDHAMSTAESYRMVMDKLAGQHRVGAGNIYLVLNKTLNGCLSPDEFHDGASHFAHSMGVTTFPPVATTIPWDQEIPISTNARRSPLTVKEMARPIHIIGDSLFGQKEGYKDNGNGRGKILNLGFLKIRKS
ncbi:MAG: AAA family ATPase [Anaerolineaceae bacterium]|nr:AAA family ATPase [Anaerolineaceae bacterium]